MLIHSLLQCIIDNITAVNARRVRVSCLCLKSSHPQKAHKNEGSFNDTIAYISILYVHVALAAGERARARARVPPLTHPLISFRSRRARKNYWNVLRILASDPYLRGLLWLFG